MLWPGDWNEHYVQDYYSDYWENSLDECSREVEQAIDAIRTTTSAVVNDLTSMLTVINSVRGFQERFMAQDRASIQPWADGLRNSFSPKIMRLITAINMLRDESYTTLMETQTSFSIL